MEWGNCSAGNGPFLDDLIDFQALFWQFLDERFIKTDTKDTTEKIQRECREGANKNE